MDILSVVLPLLMIFGVWLILVAIVEELAPNLGKLPPKTDFIGDIIFWIVYAITIWNEWDNLQEMSLPFLFGFSVGLFFGAWIISYILAVIVGAFLKLKDSLD